MAGSERGIRSPWRWRKLQLGDDVDTRAIVAAELMPDDVGELAELPGLPNQIDTEIVFAHSGRHV
jgi:hypothetical protein